MTPYTLKGCWIAGGAITSHVTKREISDYDIYPKTIEARNEAIMELCENGIIISFTDKAVTIKTNDYDQNGLRQIYQIMIIDDQLYTEAQDIFDLFDFSVCMGAYDCDTKKFVYGENFLLDNASRTMKFNTKTRFPFASILRTIKYQKKGYTLPKVEFCKMIFTVLEKGGPKSWSDVELALGGYYGDRIKLLRDFENKNRGDDVGVFSDLINDKKCETEELEFNYENLMIVLENCNEDNFTFCTADELDGHNIDPETLIELIDPRDKYYHILKESNEILIFDDEKKNGYFTKNTSVILNEIDKKEKWKKLDGRSLLKSFKSFKITDDPKILGPVSHMAKDCKYVIDELHVNEISPYVYVAKNFQGAKNYSGGPKTKDKVIREVYFLLDDIMKSDHNSFQVKRLLVSDLIDEENEHENKFVELVESPTSKLYN